MGLLRKNYEISLWQDVWDATSLSFKERKVTVLGSDSMESQSRALEPKITSKTNGEVTFSFKMYSQYIDTITGEKVENLLAQQIGNESKIKVRIKDKWYDLLVKNISEDSKNHTYTYDLVRQEVNELSKNGYNIILDTSLMNNIGTIEELANRALQGSGWGVECEKMTQTSEEALVTFLPTEDLVNFAIYKIDDSDIHANGVTATVLSKKEKENIINSGKALYAFYSSCTSKSRRFQFVYSSTGVFSSDSNRVITDAQCQYYIENVSNWIDNNSLGISYPAGLNITFPEEGNNTAISVKYRGKKYVYSTSSTFHPGLNTYVDQYTYNNNGVTGICYGYKKTNYVTPKTIDNYVSGYDFKTTSAWRGSKFCTDEFSGQEHAATIRTVNIRYDDSARAYITSLDDACRGVDTQRKIYSPMLEIGQLTPRVSGELYKVITNSGPYDKRSSFQGFEKDEEYVIKMSFAYVKKSKNSDYYVPCVLPQNLSGDREIANVKVRMANFFINTSLQGYGVDLQGQNSTSENNKVLFYGRAKYGTGESSDYGLLGNFSNTAPTEYNFTHVVKATESISKEDFLKDKFYLFLEFLTTNSDTEDEKYYILLKELQFFKKYDKVGGGYYNPEDAITMDSISYNEETKYFIVPNDVTADTRKESEISFLPASITVIPNYGEQCGKKCTVSVKESNYFNAVQTIAETFKCWPLFEVNHDSEGNIINFPGKNYSKRVYFKNYIGQPNYAGFRYGINTQSIKRTLDSKSLVTKLIVKTNTNQFAPNGFCTIARAPSNNTKDNVLIDFGYYANQGLIDPKALQSDLYITSETSDKYDYTNSTGYYPKLSHINQTMSNLANQLESKTIALEQAKADYTVNKAGYDTSSEKLSEAIESFYQVAGFNYDNFPNLNLIVGSNQEHISNGYQIISYEVDKNEKIPESDIKIREDDDGQYASLVPGETYSITLELTPADGINYVSCHLANGWYCLGGWKKVEPNKKQRVTMTGRVPNEGWTANENKVGHTTREEVKLRFYHRTTLSGEWGEGQGGAGTKIHRVSCVRGASPVTYQKSLADGGQTAQEKVRASSSLTNYITQIGELTSAKAKYQRAYQNVQVTVNNLETQYIGLNKQIEDWRKKKEQLNQAFYDKYSRFIQEGTWLDNNYYDDNLYYLAAQSVLYTSAYPKVSYNISTLSLAGIPGYELYDFALGDQTFIEDVEMFGYNQDGTPHQEAITVTELVENLDDPTKNSIKVQNYENQFQDLFRKVSATVQQVKYTEGPYTKAAALANADTEYKLSFLHDALNSADLAISSAGAQTVTINNEGITITDGADKSRALRMIAGAILLKRKKENADKDSDNGSDAWMTGMTTDGISANLITAGQINTGAIQIMNANQPTFRWDSHGITAYDFDNTQSDSLLSGIDKMKGVRFDRFGIYGYTGIDGETWHPESISDAGDETSIDQYSTFSLTWEGLKVTGSDNITARIGKYMDSNGVASIIRVDKRGYDTFKVDTEGNVSLAGHINALSGTIGPVQIQTENEVNLAEGADNVQNWSMATAGSITFDESEKALSLYAPANSIEVYAKYGTFDLQSSRTYTFSCELKSAREENNKYSSYYADIYLINQATGKAVSVKGVYSPTSKWYSIISQSFSVPADGKYSLRIDNNNFTTEKDSNDRPIAAQNESKLYIRNVKLFERGTPGALIMWDGTPGIEENLIFKVGKNTEGGYEAFIKGEIIAQKGEIAGWTIDDNSIRKGTFAINGFHMSSAGINNTGKWFGNNTTTDKWMLGIGSNFGVTSNGVIYATAGKIGNMTITQINNPTVGTNLLTYLDTAYQNFGGYSITSDPGNYVQDSATLKWRLTKTSAASGSRIYPSLFEKNKVYTLSYKFQRVGGGSLTNIGGHSSGFEQISFSIDGNEQTVRYDNPGKLFSSSNNNIHTVVWTGKFNGNAEDNSLYIQVNRAESTNSAIQYDLWDVTLVEGATAAPWGYSSADQAYLAINAQDAADDAKKTADAAIPADKTGTYSWLFNSSTGIKMWNGSQSNSNLVFSVTDGAAYFNGEIVAKSGSIGGWSIGDIKKDWYWNNGTGVGFYYEDSLYSIKKSDDDYYLMFLRAGGKNQHCMAIRKKTGASSENGSGTVSTIFSLSREGELYATDAKISGEITANTGYLGGKKGWTITSNRIYSGTLGSTGFHMCNIPSQVGYAIGKHFGCNEENAWALGIGSGFGVDYLGKVYATGGKLGKFFIRTDGFSSQEVSTSNHAPQDMTLTASDLTFYSVSDGSDALPSEAILTATGVGAYFLDLPTTIQWTTWAGIINMVNNKSSDARLKKDICSLDERFDTFFDYLRPSQYKYINGSSGRTHTGFIAQEVVEALTSANLSTQDFAAVMLERVSENESYWSLRRDEFVSLNTWQIQKLKPRMTSAEGKIAQLELQISSLTTELENLKKTQNSDIINIEE